MQVLLKRVDHYFNRRDHETADPEIGAMGVAKSGNPGKTPAAYALIQKDDIKARHWQAAAARIGYTLRIMPGSAVYVPFHLFRNLCEHGRPEAVVWRYLNDYPSVIKSVIRVISEVVTVLLCSVLRIRLVWICHNVDRESAIYRPLLTSFRRWLFTRFSHRILVTDGGLIPLANRILRRSKKIDFITFGKLEPGPGSSASCKLTRDVKEFVERERQLFERSQTRVRIGWSAGFANWKTAHFERVVPLLDAAERNGFPVRMIVVLANPKYMRQTQPAMLEALGSDPRIFLHEGYVEVQEDAISSMIDFYWRVYRDFSVPVSVYHAAGQRKPILTQDVGFLSELVSRHELGAVMGEDFADLTESLDALERWDPTRADLFLKEHRWSMGARKLMAACHQQS